MTNLTALSRIDFFHLLTLQLERVRGIKKGLTEPSAACSDLPKVTQLVSGRVNIKTRTWFEDSFHYFSAALKNQGWNYIHV
jgi:hypothetical protein